MGMMRLELEVFNLTQEHTRARRQVKIVLNNLEKTCHISATSTDKVSIKKEEIEVVKVELVLPTHLCFKQIQR
nr:hypothetical protein CFP56_53055 [Quercus suber]